MDLETCNVELHDYMTPPNSTRSMTIEEIAETQPNLKLMVKVRENRELTRYARA